MGSRIKQQPCPTEYQEQCAVIFWARVNSLNDKRLLLLHGDSSGVRVSIGTALKMKKAGNIKGWPDLFLPVPCESQHGQYYCCGLFIELKRRRGGVVSSDQQAVHDLLREQGYRVEVCRGADEAIAAIREYLCI
jgi:hypothetical protein